MKITTTMCKEAIVNIINNDPSIVVNLFSSKSADAAKLKKMWKRNHKEKMKDGNIIRCFDCPTYSGIYGSLRAEVIDDGERIVNISIFRL